jgi:hypothetical protein
MSFTADHHGFYHKNAPFYPVEGENIASVRLPARLSDDLTWIVGEAGELECAHKMVAEGKFLFWEIDLGLEDLQLMPEDSSSFYSFSLALEEFTKRVWPNFQEHTFGVSLYRGGADFSSLFPSSHWEREGSDEQLHTTQLFSEYLHRLVSFLPDAALIFALIDLPAELSFARQCQLFSKERFESIHLGFQSGHALATVGICLPGDDHITRSVLEQFDAAAAGLIAEGTPFRVVAEEKLTEEWDGLDRLIVFPSAVSARGKRKLLGFIAAGGVVS